MSSLLAADIPVTTINDSGAGSLRQGLSGAATGERLAFDPTLNASTLANGSTLGFGQSVTLLDVNSIVLTDAHAFMLAKPLTVDWKGTLNLNGVLSDGVTAGSLSKTGTGTLALSGANSYTGGTTLFGGTLRALNDSAIGTGTLTVNSQAGSSTLDLGNGVNLGNHISFKTGLIVNNDVGTTSQLSGLISESGGIFGINKTGTGTLILSGANTFSGGVYVSNDSTIRAENSSALGTGAVTVSGALTLDLANGINVGNQIHLGNHFTANVDSGTATLSGVIDEYTSSHLNKTGAGTLILSGLNAYTGGTTISQGTLQGSSNSLFGNMTNNGTVVFDQVTSGHYDGDITGSGSLMKIGTGTLILNGSHSYAGPTTINAGELQVRGAMTSDVQIANPQATLSGAGSVGNVTNDGIVQPGNSAIGSLNVNGNFTQHAAGTTLIAINAAGNTPGVNNDHLNVAGHATLDGTLNVTAVGGGVFSSGTQYTILNATGGVTGHYATVTDNLSMFNIALTYDANDVVMELQRTSSLHEVATTANQSGVGSALDNITLTSTGSLFSMINNLGAETAAQQQQALNQLSGSLFGNTQTLGLQVGDQFQQRLISRMISNGQFLAGTPSDQSTENDARGQSPTSSRSSSAGWIQGYGVGGNVRSDGNAASMNYSQGGALYGVDLAADETGMIGVTGGNSYVGFGDGFGGGGQLTSYQAGLYALKHNDTAYLLGSANYGYDSFGTNRNVFIGGTNQTLRGSYGGNQLGTYTEAGLKFDARWVHFQPLVGLQYLYLSQGGFSESGGPAALNVSASQANSLRTNVGGRIIVHQLTGPWGAVWTPYWHGRWVAELLDNDRIVNSSFNGAPIGGSFTAHGSQIGTNYGIIGKGVQVQLTDQWSLYGNYDVMFGGRIDTSTGAGGVVYIW